MIVFVLLFIAGCTTQTIKAVKIQDNVDKEVAVKGKVVESVKIGSISGYLLKDINNDTIYVSSSEIPADSKEVVAKGVLKKKPVVGYYIEAIKE